MCRDIIVKQQLERHTTVATRVEKMDNSEAVLMVLSGWVASYVAAFDVDSAMLAHVELISIAWLNEQMKTMFPVLSTQKRTLRTTPGRNG